MNRREQHAVVAVAQLPQSACRSILRMSFQLQQARFLDWTMFNPFRTMTVAIAVVLLLAGRATAAPPEERGSAVTPEQRRIIDKRARHLPREERMETHVEFHGDLTSWLIARTPLPGDEEAKRAAAAHDEMLARYATSDVPEIAQQFVDQLVGHLPARLQPDEGTYQLTVLETDDFVSDTVGHSHIYLSRTHLDEMARHGQAAVDRLAFRLAREIGHIVRKHCRRRYQVQWLQSFQRKQSTENIESSDASESSFNPTLAEDYEADLFAIHLLRNAGFNLENALDEVRDDVLIEDARGEELQRVAATDPNASATVEERQKTGHRALQRLRRLRYELDGIVEGEGFGIFEFNRKVGEFRRVPDRGLRDLPEAIVCVHGMESDADAFLPICQTLMREASMANHRLLAFQYPSDGSLARMSKFLVNEFRRAGATTDSYSFVCHSAGGLVFRRFAEVEGGAFENAILIGVPNDGSDLARLRPILEVKQFFGDLRFGYSDAIERSIRDGRGQITFDLQPGSLFLRELNRLDRTRHLERYRIIRGRAVKAIHAALMQAGIAATRRAIAGQLEKNKNEGVRRAGGEIVQRLELPSEVTSGDLCVTLDSAAIEGVPVIDTLPLSHVKLTDEPDAIERVVTLLLSSMKDA